MSENPFPKMTVPIAKIGRFRGTLGEVFIHTHLDLAEENLEGTEVTIRFPNGKESRLVIEQLRYLANKTTCKFRGCDTIDAARALCHGEILANREHLAPLDSDQFFISDLIGMSVETLDGRALGSVTDVLTAGSSHVLQVQGEREHLIPFVETIVPEVDPGKNTILVDPPPGLLEINED